MSQDTSALNALVRTFERCRHASSDLTDLLAVANIAAPRNFVCSQSNFGPKRHAFFYQQKNITKASTVSPIEKSLAQISHLCADVQDAVTFALFSNCQLQSPVKNFDIRQKHDFIQSRRLPQLTSNNRSGPAPKKAKTPTIMTDSQITNLALRSSLLHGRKTTPKFSVLFPNTTWPTISFVQGHPRINREVFNSLLLSRIRSLKTLIAETGTPVPKNLSKNLVLRFSRMIDLSLSTEFNERKLISIKTPTVSSSTAKAQAKAAKRSLNLRFTAPEKKAIEPVPVPSVPQEDSTPPDLEETIPPPNPLAPLNPWDEFKRIGNSLDHLSPDEGSRLFVIHKRLHQIRSAVDRNMTVPVLTRSELDYFSSLETQQFLALFSVYSKVFSPDLNSIFNLPQAIREFKASLSSSECWFYRRTQSPFPLTLEALPLPDVINDEVLPFYRASSERFAPYFDSCLGMLEVAVMELRSVFD